MKSKKSRKLNDSTAVAADNPGKAVTGANVAEQDIARRAYELFLARGCEPGHDLADWLQAEEALRHSIKMRP